MKYPEVENPTEEGWYWIIVPTDDNSIQIEGLYKPYPSYEDYDIIYTGIYKIKKDEFSREEELDIKETLDKWGERSATKVKLAVGKVRFFGPIEKPDLN